MLGYVCKYTPVEIFLSMGVEMKRLEPEVTNFTQADTQMHTNVCSYAKAVLEEAAAGDYEGIILTNCCDSIRRLYDTLRTYYPDKFFYLLDVPRKVNDFAVDLYEKHIREMIRAYETFSGRAFRESALRDLLSQTEIPEESLLDVPDEDNCIRLGVLGARCNAEILQILRSHGVRILFDLTCTGLSRHFAIDDSNLLSSYCAEILYQIPCMRMVKATNRTQFLDGFTDRLDGILYHTIKFCDHYSYEYADLKQALSLPVLSVETDATRQSLGQIRTRLEAFIEELDIKKGLYGKSLHMTEFEPILTDRGNAKMYVLGIDSGSTSTNAVILDGKMNILATHVVRTGAKTVDSAERILTEILEKASLVKTDISLIVSTGYGRVSIPFADQNVTEISCHGKGAHFLNPDIRTILDIGGQDSKAIRLNERGDVIDFVMNDKCAAGTGRFLEMMARTLEIGIDELGPISLKWKDNIAISSMCSVFAESEVISLIALNREKADIAHGVHTAIAGKAMSLLKKVGLEQGFMMTGGVAKNPGVVAVLEELLHARLFIYEEPEIVGALGAALFGLESLG